MLQFTRETGQSLKIGNNKLLIKKIQPSTAYIDLKNMSVSHDKKDLNQTKKNIKTNNNINISSLNKPEKQQDALYESKPLVDMGLPNIQGTEVPCKIREIELKRDAHPNIIAHTSNDISAKSKCLISGMDDFLTKPFEIDQLKCANQRLNKGLIVFQLSTIWRY